VLPQFAQVFEDLERPIPPLTAALLEAGKWVRAYWLPLGLAFAALVGVGLGPRVKPWLRQLLDHHMMHAVVIRNAVRPLLAGRVFRLLGTMLENGVPLLEGVRLCAQASSNRLLQEMFQRVEKDILNGDGMAGALNDCNCLPQGAAHMVSTGERTGQLASVLISVGDYFEAEGERQLKSLVKLLEPAIIIGLGGVISVIVLSIMLPMLDMSSISG
jgi:general secretion pathway protein F